MVEHQSGTAEDRLAAIEARLRRIESALLLRAPTLSGGLGPESVVTVTFSGPQVEMTVIEKPARLSLPEMKVEKETVVAPWKHLVARRHPWRRQLYVKGRNLTVRQLVGGVKANRLSEEQAAANYDLPAEAIREALTYAAENAELLDLEAAYERFLLAEEGKHCAPQPVS
jgi:uncharacterized protein (DUF433 family)